MAADPDLPIYNVRPLDQLRARSVAPRRFTMTLLSVFAAVAVFLAAVGIYGVISYSTAERTREIGIRLALGARRNDVLRLVVGEGLVTSIAGLAIGLIMSFALTRFLESLLFGVSATDAVTFIVVPIILMSVALVASLVPARRATKFDPVTALRCE